MMVENNSGGLLLYATPRLASSVGPNTVFLVAKGIDGKWYTDTLLNGDPALNLKKDVCRSKTLDRFLQENSDRFRIVTIDDVTLHLGTKIDYSAHGIINQFMDCYIGYSKGRKLN